MYRAAWYDAGMDDEGAKVATSFRLTADVLRLLRAVGKKLGVPKTAVVEMAVREFARKHKVE